MKKTLAFFLAFSLALSAPSVFAQMPLGAPATPAAAPVFEKIGVIAAAQGRIELKIPGQIGRVARSGQAVFVGDEITTDEEGHLQILFLDQTVFTLGPNSTIIINEFAYDPKSHEGAMKTSITKGVFRYVSGKIAAKKPNGVMVKLPMATLGFRGTIVGGQVNQDGSALAALLGPGSNNDAGEKIGSFVISGTGANVGHHREVNRTGFGVRVDVNGDLSGVFQLSQADIRHLTAGLAPYGRQSRGSGGGSVTDRSGEGTVLTVQDSDVANFLGDLSASNDDTTDTAAQYSADSSRAVADGITTVEQLTRIVTGIYHYSGSGTFTQTKYYGSTSDISGVISSSWDYNHASKQFENASYSICTASTCGQYAGGNIDVSNASLSSVPLGSSGPAVFSTTGTNVNATVTLLNSNNQVAQNGEIKLNYSANGGYDQGSGGFTAEHT